VQPDLVVMLKDRTRLITHTNIVGVPDLFVEIFSRALAAIDTVLKKAALRAHATTTVNFPTAGTFRVFVRTKDWVARWQAPGTPGSFQVLVNGTPLDATFDTQSAAWDWQDGGSVIVRAPCSVTPPAMPRSAISPARRP